MARVNHDHVDRLHNVGLYIPTRTIYIGSVQVDFESESGTDAFMAEKAVKNLHVLDNMSQDSITIIMNNLGGDWSHGMAIYDAIQACRSHVRLIVSGQASSMGSLITQAADERIMMPSAKMLIHYGHISIAGHPKEVGKAIKDEDRTNHLMEKIYLEKIREKHPDYQLSKLQKLLDFDTTLWAQDAVNLGLADSIFVKE